MGIGHFKRRNCETAKEFLEFLSPSGMVLPSQGKEWWMFRGQAREQPIIASALREQSKLHEFGCGPDSERREYSVQCFVEKSIIKHFFHLSDRTGLSLPEDSQILRQELASYGKKDYESWPPKHCLSLIGLAQHYGLPTRLIDWTWNPFVAAFFAATGAKKKIVDDREKDGDEIIVTGMRSEVANPQFLDECLNAQFPNYTLELITAPTAGNVNLKAQEGLFLMVKPRDPKAESNHSWPGVMELVKSAERVRVGKPGIEMTLTCEVTLPYSKVSDLLILLDRMGFSNSRIFPSFDGVISEMRN